MRKINEAIEFKRPESINKSYKYAGFEDMIKMTTNVFIKGSSPTDEKIDEIFDKYDVLSLICYQDNETANKPILDKYKEILGMVQNYTSNAVVDTSKINPEINYILTVPGLDLFIFVYEYGKDENTYYMYVFLDNNLEMLSNEHISGVNLVNESMRLNELNSKTYWNAANKAGLRGQYDRKAEFKKHAVNTMNKELDLESKPYIKVSESGFVLTPNNKYKLRYDVYTDTMYPFNDRGKGENIEPGDTLMRLPDRSMIRTVLDYFTKYKPDSKFNNRQDWIR